jgi:8-oxo-dGTP pyrophosphatase MutT (NUDIX family)
MLLLRLHARAAARLSAALRGGCEGVHGGACARTPVLQRRRGWGECSFRGVASLPLAPRPPQERAASETSRRWGASLAAGAVGLACACASGSGAEAAGGGGAADAPAPPHHAPHPPHAPLAHRVDSYGGVVVDADGLPPDAAAFAAALAASVSAWVAAGRRGVWLKLPLEHAALVPPAVAAGFIFHHAEPGHLMLTRWLPSGPSPLPANASHQVGVGAFVLNAAGEVLVVQERAGPAARPGFWKLPTGLVNQGEEIHAAAVREVCEETGVDAEFVGVVGVRQAHGLAFGKDDLFFLCALRLKDGSAPAPALTPQEGEIAAAAWMPLEQFGLMPHVADPGTVWGHLHVLCGEWAAGRYAGIEAHSLPTGVGRPGCHTVYNAAGGAAARDAGAGGSAAAGGAAAAGGGAAQQAQQAPHGAQPRPGQPGGVAAKL